MSEYAIYKNQPVVITGPLHATVRDKDGKPVGQGEFLGYNVRLPFGHTMIASPDSLEAIKREQYDALVKVEKADKAEYTKKSGFGTEIVYKGSGFTNAGCERGR